MKCDMCGSESELFKTNIEGAMMSVCKGCSGFGKVIAKIKAPEPKVERKPIPQRPEIIMMVVKDYDAKIKNARERMGLKQEELAKKLKEKLSIIHQLETKHMKPSIDLARKFEKFLKIKLVEDYQETHETRKADSKSMTIGDMIKVR